VNPRTAEALRRAREAAAAGALEVAISRYRDVLRAEPSAAIAQRELARVYLRLGWQAEAERCVRTAIALDPDDDAAHAELAAMLFAQGRLAQCAAACVHRTLRAVMRRLPGFLRRLVAARPDPGASQSAAAAAAAAAVERVLEDGNLAPQALVELERIVAARPDQLECHLALARAYSALGRVKEAAAHAESAFRLDPASAPVHAAIAASLHPWNNAEAERFARRALALDPELDLAHASLGAALWTQNRLAEAEHHCREALRLNPERLSHRLALAFVLRHRGRLDEARALLSAVDLETTGSARACTDWGCLVLESGADPEEARRWFRRAQALADDARAHFQEAMLDLACGKLAEGWERYEARKVITEQDWHRAMQRFAQWDGRPLGERRLLVYGEQGLGDEIMFASMLPDVRALAPRLTLACDARLATLFARSFPGIEVVPVVPEQRAALADSLTGIDFQIAAGSLGRLFRRKLADFPAHRGYLVADPERVRAWRERLGGLGPGLKIGLSWAGGVAGTGRSRRSVALERLGPLVRRPGACWVSLQHGPEADELVRGGAGARLRIAHYDGVTRDPEELVALIAALDLVISVCNANVHLSGALGKEVWVMAPFAAEWRYGRDGERMPWYPSARVLRQPQPGDWDNVIRRVVERLDERISQQRAGASERSGFAAQG
jgi:tetratricopeptide (TPR) repeat protein